MRILGIETSCDETAAAIVDDGRIIRANVVASQVPLHRRFGGVVPEIASRQHVLAIANAVRDSLAQAETPLDTIDAVAVTRGPGLSGALLVGVNFAKGLALARGIPLLAVNHIEGHIYSVWLAPPSEAPPEPVLPMVSLVVSGGHTELVAVEGVGEYRILGRTRDDAVGEAYDKVGRLLGLPYPGGPSVEAAASRMSPGDAPVHLPRAWLPQSFDFSFSGLKTAVLRRVQDAAPGDQAQSTLDDGLVAALAAGFQDSVVDVLTGKLRQAVADVGARSASVVGGVSANRALRRAVLAALDVPVCIPYPGLSTDNAAMIAGAAYFRPAPAGYSLDADPSLELSAATLSA